MIWRWIYYVYGLGVIDIYWPYEPPAARGNPMYVLLTRV